MNLQLRMIKTPEGASLSQKQFSFDRTGGTLGRGPDNHWVLPDPERILSALHCEFVVDSGRFQLIDHSTNGTFVNGSSEPLGKGVVTAVNHGDQVEVGDYAFVIDLMDADPEADNLSPFASEPAPVDAPAVPFGVDDPFASDPFDAGPVADPAQSSLDPLQVLDGAGGAEQDPWYDSPAPSSDEPGQNAFGGAEPHWQDPAAEAVVWPEARQEQLIPDDWLESELGVPAAEPETQPETPVWSEPPEEPPVRSPEVAPPAQEASWSMEASQPAEPLGYDTPSSRDTDRFGQGSGPAATPTPGGRGRKVEATQPVKTRPEPTRTAPESAGRDALFSALGVDLNRMSPEAREDLEPLLGTMMREVIEGLMQVLRSRASIKNEFRMNVTTIQPVENNPLKFSADVDEALDNIFVRRSQAYKEPLQAIREGFQEIAEHQLAMIAGMRSAFEHMLREFDPERLEANSDKQQKPSALAPLRKARYWDNYRAHYQGLSDNMERSFQQIFGDEFVQAYQEQLRRLSALRP